jgi:hypothetical protein
MYVTLNNSAKMLAAIAALHQRRKYQQSTWRLQRRSAGALQPWRPGVALAESPLSQPGSQLAGLAATAQLAMALWPAGGGWPSDQLTSYVVVQYYHHNINIKSVKVMVYNVISKVMTGQCQKKKIFNEKRRKYLAGES